MPKIIQLDPNKPNIATIIKELDEMKEDLDSIFIVYQKKDKTYDVAYNFQSVKNLVFMSKINQLYIDRMMLGNEEAD